VAATFALAATKPVSAAAATRSVNVSAGAFMRDLGSTDIVASIYYGLRWAAGSTERAGVYLYRPPDWDGQSPVRVRLRFARGAGGRRRPRICERPVLAAHLRADVHHVVVD
jgi:hypothetical protein